MADKDGNTAGTADATAEGKFKVGDAEGGVKKSLGKWSFDLGGGASAGIRANRERFSDVELQGIGKDAHDNIKMRLQEDARREQELEAREAEESEPIQTEVPESAERGAPVEQQTTLEQVLEFFREPMKNIWDNLGKPNTVDPQTGSLIYENAGGSN